MPPYRKKETERQRDRDTGRPIRRSKETNIKTERLIQSQKEKDREAELKRLRERVRERERDRQRD